MAGTSTKAPHKQMIYKFKSSAAGDVIMLGPQGEQMLRILGKEPAAQGIIETAAMSAAIQALEAAIAQGEKAAPGDSGAKDDEAGDRAAAVGLRARLWPMIELLRRSQSARADVTWGV